VRKQYSDRSVVTQVDPRFNPSVHLVREDWFGGSFWDDIPFQTGTPSSDLEDRALTSALNKLKGNQVNIGVALAEAKQTARLLTEGAKTIADGVTRYRRLNVRDWKAVQEWERGGRMHWDRRQWRKIPRKWLELQYGWNPLMSDIHGACTALEKTWNQKYPLIGVQASASETEQKFRTGTGQYGSTRTERTDYVHSHKVALYFLLANSWLAQFNALGLVNPALIVWEKVPYSFVVDWFLPIGNWLSALDADFGYTFKAGTHSAVTRGRGNIIGGTIKRRAVGWIPSGDLGSVTSTYFEWRRDRYTSLPVPGLHFKNPISPYHIANAMSLLVEAFSRSGKKPIR